MALAKGTRLGPYEVASAIGAGGMGEVYRARDTRLDRFVAIKILHSDLPCNAELKSRFEREARTLSSLAHPHICSLYDVGREGEREYLVMELLEGETLSARLQRGPLQVSAVVKLGIQIAEALAKAHRLGVIHRDLKPSNIMMTANGAKLMDFGLAKPNMAGPVAGSHPSSSLASLATATLRSPSSSLPLSTAGTLIGTIQYMAPEQIEGKEADERSDIFALGDVLYEAVTGQRAFEGKTHLSVASAILQRDPQPITTAGDAGSPALDYVIRTCMAKEPDERFQTAHDVKLQLAWVLRAESLQPAAQNKGPAKWTIGALAALVLLLAASLIFLKAGDNRRGNPDNGLTRFSIALPPHQELADLSTAIALSSDGKRLAYVAEENGVPHLYTRRFDRFDAVQIPDSEGAVFPFFSPNGDWVAFFNQQKLKKAPADGGAPVAICAAPTFFGGTWTPKDTIVVAVPNYGLATVPASGGTLARVPMKTKDAVYPQGPTSLNGGDWVLFTDYGGETRSVLAVRLATGETKVLVDHAQAGAYESGHLIYFQGGTLWAAPFDPDKLAVVGNATQIESGVNEVNYVAQWSVSENGVVAYAPGPAANFLRNLYLVDRKGGEQKLDVEPHDYVDPAVSPDGKRIAFGLRGISGQAIAILDRDRGLLNSLASLGAVGAAPIWEPDGQHLLFDGIVGPGGVRGIYRTAADGSSGPQLIRATPLSSHVTSVAGETAAVMVNDPARSTGLWFLNLHKPEEMRPFKDTSAAERQGSLSPDGHWLAYASNESGRSEVYIEPVPGPGGRRKISSEGGEQPRWLRNGREITYRIGTKMMSVPVEVAPVFRAGKPVELFDRKYDRGGAVAGYDVSPDGQQFVMTRSEHAAPTEIRVVMGWNAEKPSRQ